jgi:hypothetical protein
MPGDLVCEARTGMALLTSHNWLVVATFMDLTGGALKAPYKIW